MDLLVGIEGLDLGVRDVGWWIRDVADIEDDGGLGFSPGRAVGRDARACICAVVGYVGGRHCVVGFGRMLEMHIGGEY